jgi:CRP-like cAMP-binding protein
MSPIQQTDFSDNTLLSAFSQDDFVALAPAMLVSVVQRDEVLITKGAKVVEVHFPLTADLSNRTLLRDGHAIETSAVGPSDVSGLAAFLADEPIAWEVRVREEGQVIRLPADLLRHRALQSTDLMRLLLSVTHTHQARAAQLAACNAAHDVTQRVARYLLNVMDRTGSSEISLTQDELAEQLGAQRTTINGAARTLKAAGAISYLRARVAILDQARLQSYACGCHAAFSD